MKIAIKLVVSDEQETAMREFAAANYDRKHGITWRDVAQAWAKIAFDDYLREYMERQERMRGK
jgi:hypothetical protein